MLKVVQQQDRLPTLHRAVQRSAPAFWAAQLPHMRFEHWQQGDGLRMSAQVHNEGKR